MPLRTYLGQTIIEDIVLVDVDSQYVPGSRVVNRAWSSHRPVPSPGLIITAEYEENCPVFPSSITVLWPDVPAAIDFSSMIMPIVRQTFNQEALFSSLIFCLVHQAAAQSDRYVRCNQHFED